MLGLGAGDSAGEHDTMGLPTDSPMGRVEEGLQVVRTLLRDGHLDHSGTYYTVRDAELIPRGPRPTWPPILIGTLNPKPRMRRIVSQYADIWNGWLGYTDASPEAAEAQSDRSSKPALSTVATPRPWCEQRRFASTCLFRLPTSSGRAATHGLPRGHGGGAARSCRARDRPHPGGADDGRTRGSTGVRSGHSEPARLSSTERESG